jgi:LytR cell envelope-related transcriptional attenuator
VDLIRPAETAPAADSSPLTRIRVQRAAAATALATLLTLALVVALAHGEGRSSAAQRTRPLAPPGTIAVDVLNGGGGRGYASTIATRVGTLGYRIGHVIRANRVGYRRTAVYFEPGCDALAQRLANQLGCGATSPLPAGRNPRRLVVIVGRPSATC